MKQSLVSTHVFALATISRPSLRIPSKKILSLNIVLTLFVCLLFSLLSKTAFADDLSPLNSVEAFEEQFSEAQLAQMLAPIALYPDSLLTHILISATYPLEVIEAKRWLDSLLEKNSQLTAKQIADKTENKDWDASVKALVPFPRILTRLNDDLTWTRQLGDAFLQDEQRLLATIQTLRQQAEAAGSLDKMENMAISRESSNIVIEPLQPEVIYVPYYDTRVVYGNWYWHSYPPMVWAAPLWPHNNYVHVSYYNPFYWHSGIHISVNYFFSAFNWHSRHIVVVNHHQSHHYRRSVHIVKSGYAKRWHHQPVHRKGVAYRTSVTKERYRSNRVSVSQRYANRDTRSIGGYSTNKSYSKVRSDKMRHQNFSQKLSKKRYSSNTKQGSHYLASNTSSHKKVSTKAKNNRVTNKNVTSKQRQKSYSSTQSTVTRKQSTISSKSSKSYQKRTTKAKSTSQNRSKTQHSRAARQKSSTRRSSNSGSKKRNN